MLCYSLYRLPSRRVRVSCLYDYLISYYGMDNIQYTMDNIQNWEQMNAFIIDLRCARFIYRATLLRGFRFCEVFLHKEATWSSKQKLILKRIPSSFFFKLLLIVSFLTLILMLPVVSTSRWHLPGFVLRKPVKNLICIFFSNFTIFLVLNQERKVWYHLHN